MVTISFPSIEAQAPTLATPRIATQARPPAPKRSYRNLIETIAAKPNAWFSVLPAGLAGESLAAKRITLSHAGSGRGYRIQTTIQGQQIFARIIVSPSRKVLHG